jgi:predicted enzyme related to lactoylglutathione lyase
VDAEEIQPVLDRAVELGGRTTQPIREIPGVVTYAVLADPAGNEIGVLKSGEGPGTSAGSGAPMDWFEILGPDPKALWAFYRDLLGWDIKEGGTEEFAYGEVHPANGSSGGIGSSPDGRPHVNAYARVEDVTTALEQAEGLGGTTIVPATKMGDGLVFGQFTDPQGTWFGVYARTG